MMRLKWVRCSVSIANPGEPASSVSNAPQWQADDKTEIQVEGGWIAIWREGKPLPRLVPVQQVQYAEPIDVPKGFQAPDWDARKREREAAAAKVKAEAAA